MTSRHGSAGAKHAPASIFTHNTILILGGFLIGMAAVDMAAAEFRNYLYLAGSFGVVAWIGLAEVARRRRQQAASRAEELGASRMRGRVDRPVVLESRRGRRTRIHTTETSLSQHLPVVVRSRTTGRAAPDRLATAQ
ncbi:MAG TPA: hypothetical protein VML55_04510 [Planctomycetaceae bacterium]|nr:hypothetical protein [Planctomycetaceae bacterium]